MSSTASATRAADPVAVMSLPPNKLSVTLPHANSAHWLFERNMLNFNPGWDAACNTLPSFSDVREIQHELLRQGLTLDSKVDEDSEGPGSIMLVDPDGNPVLIDQHV
jgi:hypothetical protein